ncbi:MAG TPA: hypothetical protein VKB51_07555, partial [bacterium]|nr:hypothetical protein [bacterium]
ATISNLLSDADLLLFTDKFTTSVPCANHNDTSGESCSYTTPSDGSITALYIQVKSFSDTGTDFQLTVQ